MKELLILLILGITLSIDAFSISTIIGMTSIKREKILFTSIIVGLFHFFMPLLGLLLEYIISTKININTNVLLGIILFLISIQMFIEYIKPSKKEFKISNTGTLLFAFGVSLDSFSIGLGIKAITDNIFLASTIFTLCSFSFTYLGLTIGKYISEKFNKYSYFIGTIILFLLSIYFLFK